MTPFLMTTFDFDLHLTVTLESSFHISVKKLRLIFCGSHEKKNPNTPRPEHGKYSRTKRCCQDIPYI